MNPIKLFVPLIVFIFTCKICIAQSPSNCNCGEVLAEGIYSEIIEKNEKIENEFYEHYKELNEYEKNSNSSSQKFNLLTKSFYFDHSESNDSEAERKREYIDYLKSKYDLFESNYSYKKFGDPKIVNAWEKCKRNCINPGEVLVTFEQLDPLNYKIFIDYKSGPGIKEVILSNVRIDGVIKESSIPEHKAKLKSGKEEFFLKKKNSNDEINISFAFKDRPQKSIYLAPSIKQEQEIKYETVQLTESICLNARDGENSCFDVRANESNSVTKSFDGEIIYVNGGSDFGQQDWFSEVDATVEGNTIIFSWKGADKITNKQIFTYHYVVKIKKPLMR